MMRTFKACVLVTAAFLLVPLTTSGQSLGDVAAQEKEKSKDKKKTRPVKIYTEDDLRRAGGRVSTGAETNAPAPAPDSPGTVTTTASAGRTSDASEDGTTPDPAVQWRERWDRASAEVNRLTQDVQRVEEALGALSYTAYSPGRASLENQLTEAKKQLAAAQQTLVDLEEQRRRSGFRRP